MKKFLLITQHWGSTIKGFKKLNHLDQLSPLQPETDYTILNHEPELSFYWGNELYEILPTKNLRFIGANYDTSD
jgi:hypothetical protein